LASVWEEKAKTMRAEALLLRKTVKAIQKELKTAQTQKGKKKEKDPNAPKRKPAGFAKPTKLSPALCDFLGVSHDTEIARTDVTKMLTQYIKDNELQNPENKREIRMDKKLGGLLNPPSDVVVTFFTLQTYMKPHFIKSVPVEEGSSVAPPAEPVAVQKKESVAETASAPPVKKKVVVKKKVKA